MLLKTHLAFAFLAIILFFTHVSNKIIFILMVLVATVIPDIDINNSSWGRHLIFRPIQFFIRHRGLIHSFTLAIILSAVIAIFWPIASLGIFIGYSVHLLTDSFTKDGIQPFWPLKTKSAGFIASGGRIEESIFIFLILIDIILAFLMIAF